MAEWLDEYAETLGSESKEVNVLLFNQVVPGDCIISL